MPIKAVVVFSKKILCFSKEPKRALNMWAYFLRKPVDKNYQNSPNLVTLVAGEVVFKNTATLCRLWTEKIRILFEVKKKACIGL